MRTPDKKEDGTVLDTLSAKIIKDEVLHLEILRGSPIFGEQLTLFFLHLTSMFAEAGNLEASALGPCLTTLRGCVQGLGGETQRSALWSLFQASFCSW